MMEEPQKFEGVKVTGWKLEETDKEVMERLSRERDDLKFKLDAAQAKILEQNVMLVQLQESDRMFREAEKTIQSMRKQVTDSDAGWSSEVKRVETETWQKAFEILAEKVAGWPGQENA